MQSLQREKESLKKEIAEWKKRYEDAQLTIKTQNSSSNQPLMDNIDSMFPTKTLKYESSEGLFLIKRHISQGAPTLFTALAYLLEPITYSSLTANNLSLEKAAFFMKKYASASILKYSDKFKQEEL